MSPNLDGYNINVYTTLVIPISACGTDSKNLYYFAKSQKLVMAKFFTEWYKIHETHYQLS
jgi:hypothetical protein